MGSINLYKIGCEKRQLFFQTLSIKLQHVDTIEIEKENQQGEASTFVATLYTSRPQSNTELGWNWVLEEFQAHILDVTPTPKAVLAIEKEDDTTYAVTFGHAYFLVDKFCDGNFGFNFARKTQFQEIKTTTLTTPNSRRNKTINTYINYNEFEFDSGESFAKLKAKASLPDGFAMYKPALEIGSSIKFSTAEDSLDQVLDLILHIENILETQEDKYQIPVFSKITDTDYKQRLDQRLLEDVRQNPAQINISELDIIGATEVFNHNDSEFKLKYRGKEEPIVSLSNDELKDFCRENGWEFANVVLDLSVVSLYDGQPVRTDSVKNLIDYTNDEERCMLSKGVWFKYNDDYLNYLRDSIAEIDVEYHPDYDFSSAQHDAFVELKYVEEKDSPAYVGMSEDAIKASLKNKYYAERAFNLIRERDNGFQNFDRDGRRIGNGTVELMDLYKDRTMFAVKIGNTSGKLCYAIDQSLSSLKIYKHKQLTGIPEINTVALWFVLERREHIETDVDGKPDINSVGMLMLRNRLDQWKKEVRLQGVRPLVYINYRTT